jgi:FdhD protein
MDLCHYSAILVSGDRVTEVRDAICVERTIRLYLNDKFLTELVVSPVQLKELGVGFFVCEGLVQSVDAVSVVGNEVRVSASVDGLPDWVTESGGGLASKKAPRRVQASLTLEASQVPRLIREIESDLWRKTGAVHCSALFSQGTLIVRSCDVGRHNTVDKVVGFAILNGIDLSKCVIACTGRQPAGMVSKVANAGIPIVISKAATTDKGILTAQEAGVTLICFARGDRFTVYSHPERILELIRS